MEELEFSISEVSVLIQALDKYMDEKRAKLTEVSKVKTQNQQLIQIMEEERAVDEMLVDELSLLKAKLIMRRRTMQQGLEPSKSAEA